MEFGIQNYKDLFEVLSYVATTIGGISLFYAVYNYNISKKQLNFAVLDRCISTFQKEFISISENTKIEDLRRYIDFVNEELFYFEQKYIPKAVAYEWIDGIIDILPIYREGTERKVLNSEKAINKIVENNLLHGYPRVKKAFTLKDEYKIKLIYSEEESDYLDRRKERERLIKEIYGNLR